MKFFVGQQKKIFLRYKSQSYFARFMIGLAILAGCYSYASATPTTYGPPYKNNDAYVSNPSFPTIDQVVADWWSKYQAYWHVGPGCNYTVTPLPNGQNTGAFASILLSGACGGGDQIGGTACSGFFRIAGQCIAVNPVNVPGADTKNNGGQCQCEKGEKFDPVSKADPINSAIGNNWRTETDFAAIGSVGGLSFTRTYNSNVVSTDAGVLRSIGAQWTQPFDRHAVPIQNPRQTPYTPACYTWSDDSALAFCVAPPAPASGSAVTGVKFIRPDGKTYVFGQVGNAWVSDSDVSDTVTATYANGGTTVTGWTYVAANGDETERYDGNGNLLSVATRSGALQTMTYSNGSTNNSLVGRYPANAPSCPNVEAGAVLPAGLLLCVTDNWGHQIQFEYDSLSRISKMIDSNSQPYLYGYDGPSGGCATPDVNNLACSANNLTQVTYPDGNTQTYWYNEAAQINGGAACPGEAAVAPGFGAFVNALTGLVDENGSRYSSWTYDCSGRATGNQLAGGVRQTTFSYGTPNPSTLASTTVLTDTMGTAANPQTNVYTFGFQVVNGVSKVNSINHPCKDCGSVASYTYDANGNVTSSTDFNGNLTNYSYDLTRNLQTSRIEAVGTSQTRTITTQWHPTFRLPSVITEPGRTTTYGYDGNGNMQTKTVTANGSSRTWTYAYNAVGQILTVTGPRTDVSDVTTYDYDNFGNLASIKNALGQTTTLSNYDANGHVGLITDPNQSTTALTYSPRGWVTSKTVTAGSVVQLTLYNYDAVGQLTSVNLPNGTTLAYTYDPAHRLTSVTDNLGNSINYTLDLTGNRIGEQIKDPTGTLATQMTRTFDTVNRLQQLALSGQQATPTPPQNVPDTLLVPGGTLAPVTITLNASGSNVPFTQPLTLTATVNGQGNLGGDITFMDGATVLGTQSLINGRASLSFTAPLPLSVGTHSLSAKYDGDQYHTVLENPFSLTVVDPRSATTTTFVYPFSPGIMTAGMPFSLQVQINANPQPTLNWEGEPMMGISQNVFAQGDPNIANTNHYPPMSSDKNGPFGTVTLMDGNTNLGTEPVWCNAWLSYPVTMPQGVTAWFPQTQIPLTYKGCFAQVPVTFGSNAIGTHNITAVYSGNTVYQPSTTPTISTVTVTPMLGSLTQLACVIANDWDTPTSYFTVNPTYNWPYGEAFDCEIMVTTPTPSMQVGNEGFVDLSHVSVQLLDGTTVLGSSPLMPPTNKSPDSDISNMNKVIVNNFTSTTRATTIGIMAPPTSVGWTTPAGLMSLGVHNLQAVFPGTAQFQGSSSPVQQVIVGAKASSTMTMNCPATLVTGQAGGAWTQNYAGAIVVSSSNSCSVTIATAPKDLTLAGMTVQLIEGGVVLGSGTLTNFDTGFVTGIATPALSAGTHTLQARFAGNAVTPALQSNIVQVTAQ